jgi:hypothetical protein
MIKIDSLLNIIVICLITVVFGCLLGLAITRIVDYRLSDISINLPKINIPYLPEGYHDYDRQFSLYDGPHSYKSPNKYLFETFSNKSPHSEQKESGSELEDKKDKNKNKQDEQNKKDNDKEKDRAVDNDKVRVVDNDKGRVVDNDKGRAVDNDKDRAVDNDKGRVVDNDKGRAVDDDEKDTSRVDNGSTPTVEHIGTTYYKDPKNMTPKQIQKFKEKAKIYKMTLQDYINWLTLFIDDPDALPPKHLSNLLKLRAGQPLTNDDVPRDQVPYPLTAQQYFEKISSIDYQLLPQNLDTAGVQIPANYMEYSQFDSPRNLKHLDDYNHIEKLNKYNHKESIDQVTPKISHEWNN